MQVSRIFFAVVFIVWIIHQIQVSVLFYPLFSLCSANLLTFEKILPEFFCGLVDFELGWFDVAFVHFRRLFNLWKQLKTRIEIKCCGTIGFKMRFCDKPFDKRGTSYSYESWWPAHSWQWVGGMGGMAALRWWGRWRNAACWLESMTRAGLHGLNAYWQKPPGQRRYHPSCTPPLIVKRTWNTLRKRLWAACIFPRVHALAMFDQGPGP